MQPQWLKQMLRRLRQLLRQPQPSLKILEQYHNGGHASVLRLQDPSIPGAVDLWRIDRHHERIKFFVAVINVAKLRADLAGTNRSTGTNARGGLADHLWGQLGSPATAIAATHLWVVGWDREYSGIDKKGRHYRSHRLADVALYAVDLQGAAAFYAGDRHAHRFAREIVKRIAANEFRELAHHQSWTAAVKSIDWLKWLEALSRGPKGISAQHVLQPPIVRIRPGE